MLAIHCAWATRLLPPPISLAYSFNLACLLSQMPRWTASPATTSPPTAFLSSKLHPSTRSARPAPPDVPLRTGGSRLRRHLRRPLGQPGGRPDRAAVDL